MKRMPYFPLYIDDFIGGTVDLSAEEAGQYIRLLCYQWGNGFVPNDPAKLARIAGSPVGDSVLSKFPAGQNGLRMNQRMESERFKLASRNEIQSQKARKRWAKNESTEPPNGAQKGLELDTAAAMPRHMPEPCPPDPEPEPYPNTDKDINTLSGLQANADAVDVLNFLNEAAGRKFREDGPGMKFILARLSEKGVSKTEVLKMVSRQVAKWKGTAHEEYLRPETLFNKTKFESYYEARDMPVVLPTAPMIQREIRPTIKARIL